MATNDPLISVIVPAYNRAAYIADAINSVLNQKDAPWPLEVIIIDDGSTDNTEDIVAKTYGDDDRVQYVKIAQSGGRPAVPRNVGLKMARGKLIAFHDSDDRWAPDKLKRQIPQFEKDKNLALSYGTAEIMEGDGKLTGRLIISDMDHLAAGEKYETLLADNVISTLTVVARKDVLKEVGNFNESKLLSAVEDYELWLRVAAHFPGKIQAIKKPLAYYRQHENNISHASQTKSLVRLTNVFTAQADVRLTASQRNALQARTVNMQLILGQLRNEPDTPLVSVVMSVYNGGKFLRPAVESILNQTYKTFEFIIIDDGSTDDTAHVIRSYDDSRIRFVQRENHGLVYSLNQGVAMARGQFIARMDADDISLPSRLEKQLAALLSDEKIGNVGSFFTYIDEKTSKPGITISSPTESIDLKRTMYIYNPFPHGGSMFRREAFNAVGGYNNDLGPVEDFGLWTRMSRAGWEFAQLPEPLYLYRVNPNGISQQQNAVQIENSKRLIDDHWQKSWAHKGIRAIVKGADYYKHLDSPAADDVYHQYIHQQFVLTVGLFERRHFKTGAITMVGACLLDRSLIPKLIRPLAAGFLRKIGVKK